MKYYSTNWNDYHKYLELIISLTFIGEFIHMLDQAKIHAGFIG
jgi:hypothetical protein